MRGKLLYLVVISAICLSDVSSGSVVFALHVKDTTIVAKMFF